MYKEHKKVKNKGRSKTISFHLPRNRPVDGCSTYCFIIVSRVRPNTNTNTIELLIPENICNFIVNTGEPEQ